MLPGSILNGCTTQGSSPSGCHTRWNPKLIQMGNIKFIDFTSCNLYQIFDFICRTMHLLMYIRIYIYMYTHTHICVPWKAYLLWIETGSQKIVKHFCSMFVSSTFKASFLWWNSWGQWGGLGPSLLLHGITTISQSLQPCPRGEREVHGHMFHHDSMFRFFFMFYRGSMEETQFKAVMSSPDQAEWICHDLITSQENKRSFQVGNPPSSLLKWNPPPTALFQIAERFLFTKSFPSIGRVPSSPEPLIGDWEAHCEKRGSQKTSRCLSKKDVWVSKNIAIEVNSTLWWSQAVPYKMTRKLKTGYRSSSSPVNFTKSVNFLMFGNFKMRSGIWRIVELECFQHMSSSGGSSS